MKKKKGEYVTK